MGGALGRCDSLRQNSPVSKLEAKMVEAMRKRALEGTSMKSFNSIILKFPKIDESLRKCKAIFEKFDEDSNGAIDREELKNCFHKLEIKFSEEEISGLFEACDVNEDMGMKFKEFIVLLCLVYLLMESVAEQAKSRLGYPDLEATFETLVTAFVFLDRNRDGYVSKSEMVHAINETTSGERSSGRIAMRRFDEDSNGAIDREELKNCFHKLEIKFSEEEISGLFEACDVNEDMGMKFKEFIVLLCLVYLLMESVAEQAKSRLGYPDLEATFETLVTAFVFLDRNRDGYVSKSEMVHAINETTSGERSSGRIAMRRFEEMDWDKNGMVTFKEYLFAFTHWVGIDDIEDEGEE